MSRDSDLEKKCSLIFMILILFTLFHWFVVLVCIQKGANGNDWERNEIAVKVIRNDSWMETYATIYWRQWSSQYFQ